MTSTPYSTDNDSIRLRRQASIDSLTSRLTISSLASSTLAQPAASIISSSEYSIESDLSTKDSLDAQPYTPLDEGYNAYPDIPQFFVLCMFDFDSDDPGHAPFKKNDILKVIRCEPSGWWAAQVGDHVGWIPNAFVVPITIKMAENLQRVRHDLRVYEYEAESLYYPPVEPNLPSDGSFLDDKDLPEHDEDVLTTSSDLSSPRGFPTDVTPGVPRFNLPNDLPSVHSPAPDILVDPWQARNPAHLSMTPRTPRTPVPPNFPAPEPSPPTFPAEHRQQLRVDTTTLFNKPTPPTPVTNVSSSSSPKSSKFPVPTHLSRSRSLSSFSTSNFGPDGLSIRSPASLNRLSILAEVPQGTEGADDIDSISTRGNVHLRDNTSRLPKVWRITGDDDAQAFQNAQLAQASQPWYLKPQYNVNEIKMEYDGSVKAGTLEALVESLTVEPLRLERENTFRHTFLMTFRTFSTADRILDLLIERYELDSPEGMAHEQFMEWIEQKLRKTQARVLHVLKLWVEKYGLIEDDPQIVSRLRDFLELIRTPSALAASARHILSILDTPRQSDNNLSPIVLSTPTKRATKKIKNDLLKIDPGELARQLTLYEARRYVRIRPHECLTWAETQKGERVQNLRSFVSTSDKLAAWVKLSVLSHEALGKRADTIELWIKVADKCRMLNNYSSMSAIVAALISQVISRLQLTWAHVNKASHVDPLVKLSEPTNNFATYRHLFSSTDGPCLPYIGIFLSDMVKVSETAPDYIKVTASETSPEMTLVNFTKRQKMAEVAHTILRHQPKVRDQYKLTEVAPVMQYIEAQLGVAAGKDEGTFWMRSQEVQQAELALADIRKGLEAAGF